MSSEYGLIIRLTHLLDLLSSDWEDRDYLMRELTRALPHEYDGFDDTIARMFRRDVAALRQLGFVVERRKTKDGVQYAIRGHKRFALGVHPDMRYAPSGVLRAWEKHNG